jgi:hypothetical protein
MLSTFQVYYSEKNDIAKPTNGVSIENNNLRLSKIPIG